VGSWKNIEELEECLNLAELEAVIRAKRDEEHRHHKFLAALKGINLDEDNSVKERFAEVERRAEARRTGKTVEQLEFEEFGLDIEVEE
jgi:hypothetical protein